ncbi:STAS domain-containing protein [Flavobacterium sp. Sd200]|uniref:SulP family inorganic anion transporter n=1 Tax=Flavobacterium sp. Sd200 TaxID=2692211 RepID=UPI00136966FF|nr:SulP family inorganic anion transporter [Flavobacterium sp. Sd200]MXN90670.1 STAS domain-containing protein [Flavobacterium sp. Sd200]
MKLFDFSQKINYKNEILAGFTVAMTMIPESLSFAILAGFPPLVGLYAAFIMGIITAIFGGRPGLVSGGAGATVITLIALMQSNGIEYVFAAVALAGVFQILVGIFKLGKFIRLVPQPVMYGFVNGLAVVIFMSQLNQFKSIINGQETWLSGAPLYIMAGLVALTVGVVLVFPKITKAVPASLVAIMVVFGLVTLFGIETKTVEDIASVQGGFPPFHIPNIPINLEILYIILPYSLVMAAVGLTEGLLTLNLVDEITGTRGNSNRECIAQGSANIANGFFFGMGGCPMIAQTLVNLEAGSRSRLSGIIAAVTIMLIILVGAPVIGKLPMAALVGVMMMVAIGTFEWTSFKVINKMPRHDIFTGILVAVITIFMHNLALAVLVGVIISALVFAWDSARHIKVSGKLAPDGSKTYTIKGALFFGSTTTFADNFTVTEDPNTVYLDFNDSRIADMSAIEILNKLSTKYSENGKTMHLINLNEESRTILINAGNLVTINFI